MIAAVVVALLTAPLMAVLARAISGGAEAVAGGGSSVGGVNGPGRVFLDGSFTGSLTRAHHFHADDDDGRCAEAVLESRYAGFRGQV